MHPFNYFPNQAANYILHIILFSTYNAMLEQLHDGWNHGCVLIWKADMHCET